MDTHTVFALFVLCAITGTYCVPVRTVDLEDPVAKLEELKGKLLLLEHSLQDLNTNIDTYVAAEKQAENDASVKRSSVAGQEGAAQQDQVLDDFVHALSPTDKALLKQMKTKVQFLEAALHEPKQSANPGEDAPEEPQEPRKIDTKPLEVPQEKRDFDSESTGDDQVLQDFMAGLSPEEIALLKHNKDKVKFLQNALNEPQGQLNPGEGGSEVEERELADSELQEALHNLSPEDQKILLRNAAKAKLLINAMHEVPHPNEGEQVEAREVQDDTDLQDALQQLSPEDQQILLKNKAKAQLLLNAMHEVPQANDGESVDEREVDDAELQDALQQLSPEDKQVLLKNKAKAKLLLAAMHEAPQTNQGEEVEEREVDDDGLQEVLQQLPPEDKQVLLRNKAKAKLLLDALHETPQANPGEDVATRELEEAELQEAMQQLSPEDKQLLLKNTAKAKLLLAAMHETPQLNPGEESAEPSESKREQVPVVPPMKKDGSGGVVPPRLPPGPDNKGKLSQLTKARQAQDQGKEGKAEEVVFTAADRQLLKTVQAKLERLQASLEAFKQVHQPVAPANAARPKPKLPVNSASAAKPKPKLPADSAVHSIPKTEHPPAPEVNNKLAVDKKDYNHAEGHFGEFVVKRDGIPDRSDSAWYDKPLPDSQLGIACIGEACDCIDDDCDNTDTVSEVKRVLSNGHASNRINKQSGGVNLQELLTVLGHVKANARGRISKLEKELDALRR